MYIIKYLIDILININNHHLKFKINIKYIWLKFIQANTITKRLIEIFLNNFDFAPMQEYLS